MVKNIFFDKICDGVLCKAAGSFEMRHVALSSSVFIAPSGAWGHM